MCLCYIHNAGVTYLCCHIYAYICIGISLATATRPHAIVVALLDSRALRLFYQRFDLCCQRHSLISMTLRSLRVVHHEYLTICLIAAVIGTATLPTPLRSLFVVQEVCLIRKFLLLAAPQPTVDKRCLLYSVCTSLSYQLFGCCCHRNSPPFRQRCVP